jgi:hypothetical protein
LARRLNVEMSTLWSSSPRIPSHHASPPPIVSHR